MITEKKLYTAHNTVRELIRDNSMYLIVLSRFNIPFGFGDATVEQVCNRNGVDSGTFLAVCNLLNFDNADFHAVKLDYLIQYLKRAHSSILQITMPHIRQHLIEAINYASTDKVQYLLMKFFDDYVREVRNHIDYENNEVFQYAERLLHGEHADPRSIDTFSANHDNMASKLRELKDLFIYHYNQAENMRMSVALCDIIDCEKDLLSHFEVENRLFLPALDLLVRERKEVVENEGNVVADVAQSSLALLGEREKEIIKCIARGQSNKEIADALCISVHTVTTHRRNICAKLDIHSAAGLTIFAIIHGLVQVTDP